MVYCTEKGLTQTELARRAATVQLVIARLESGEQAPSLATLARLSRSLSIKFHIDSTPSHVELGA